jgi:hypothetical protein
VLNLYKKAFCPHKMISDVFTPFARFFFFGPLSSKNWGRMTTQFSRPVFHSMAGFDLFCRIFGQLATVGLEY